MIVTLSLAALTYSATEVTFDNEQAGEKELKTNSQ